MEPGAPILHDKGGAEKGNIYVDIHGEVGSVAAGFKAADAVHEKTYSTSRVQHVHLETHGSVVWKGDDGRIHVRTSRATELERKINTRCGEILIEWDTIQCTFCGMVGQVAPAPARRS